MRVLFLDIDGVLNSEAWHRNPKRPKSSNKLSSYWVCEEGSSQYKKYLLYQASRSFDPEAVARLNRVLDTTGASVVLSSTWRITPGGHAEVEGQLRSVGFAHSLLDRTPEIRIPTSIGSTGAPRGHEIAAWLKEHPEVERFAIVDDDEDMAELTPYLVRTSWETGLQDVDADKLIAMLTG